MTTQTTTTHYNDDYFKYQRGFGELGERIHVAKFSPHVRPTDTVLDFGCGGGYLLKSLDCQSRIGVEINPAARAIAQTNGLEVFTYTKEVPDATADLVISNHALEHTLSPYNELRDLYRVLKPGGRIVIYVPCESVFRGFKANNPDHHLYSWSPMCLGNLLLEAGFESVEARACIERYPPKVHGLIGRLAGRHGLEVASTIYGWLNPSLSQSTATGKKPGEDAPAQDA